MTLLDLIRLLLNMARNNANADGHREFDLRCHRIPMLRDIETNGDL